MSAPNSLKPVSHKGPLAWMTKNSVAANVLMWVCILGGIMGFLLIKKEVFPEFQIDLVTVNVAYPGASPEDVEQGIILAIEEAIADIEGIEEVQSTANEGVGSVTIEIDEKKNPQQITQNIKQEIDRIRTFPADAEEPSVSLIETQRNVVTLVLFGDTDELTLRNLSEQVRDQLLGHEGITKVSINDTRNLEVHIEIEQAKLNAYSLTLQEVANRIRNNVIEISGGSVSTQNGDIILRVAERRDFAVEFAQLPILVSNTGTPVFLNEIATVKEAFQDINKYGQFNGFPSVEIAVDRVGEQTPISVSEATQEAIISIQAFLPEGVDLTVVNNRADIYEQRLKLLLKNALLGLLLVMVLLTLFLDLKLAFWVTMGIPISFLGAMLFIPQWGVSFNMISMFAFIVALGIVVDDAIVAGENIYEYRQKGYSLVDAAIQGVRDVAMPITFSILTNVVAFAPLLFVSGWIGKIWSVIPAVVCTVFIVSLIEALFILPAHLAYSKPGDPNQWFHRWQQNFSEKFSNWVKTVYEPFLILAVKYRYISISIGIAAMMLILSWPISGRMGFEIFPAVESDRSEVRIVMPLGSPEEKVNQIADFVVAQAQKIVAENGGDELSTGVYNSINENRITINTYLTSPDQRPMATAEFTKQWRQAVGQIAGIESIRFASDAGGPGSGPGFTVELNHRNVETLRQASEKVAQALAEYPIISEIDDGFQEGKQQFSFTLNEQARQLGLTSSEIGRQIRAAFFGAEALRQQRERNEVKILVLRPENERNSQEHVLDLLIRTPNDALVPLHTLVHIEPSNAYSSITRRDGRRTVTVTANVNPRNEAQRIKSAVQTDMMPQLLKDFPGLSYSFEGRQRQFTEALSALGYGFLAVLCMIYILMAVPFKSYLQPLVVMFAIPFGVIGAVIGHLIMGYSMSIISMMGVIALSGVVVNDSLVMINYANQRVWQGHSPFEAITQAGVRRFRPILLTTISTFGGLAPMIFETSRQAKFMIPLALSLGYGILFATAITLILVPCLYLIIEDLRKKLGTQSEPKNESSV